MLIVQDVNVHPSAVADVVSAFRTRVTGRIEIRAYGPEPAVELLVRIRVEHDKGSKTSMLYCSTSQTQAEHTSRAGLQSCCGTGLQGDTGTARRDEDGFGGTMTKEHTSSVGSVARGGIFGIRPSRERG